MAISQYPAGSQGTPGEYGNFTRHSVENAALYKARAVGNHTTKLGACKALRERRYTPYFGVCHFNDSLFGSAAYRRARLSPPLQWRVPRNGGRYGTAVPSRDCHVGLRPPRNDKPVSLALSAFHFQLSIFHSRLPLPCNSPHKGPQTVKKPVQPKISEGRKV